MVSKSISKSYHHMIAAEPRRSPMTERKHNDYNGIHGNGSDGTSQTNSGRSSSNASSAERFYEHENGATSSNSSSINNHIVTVFASHPIWAKRKYLPSLEGIHDEILDFCKWIKPTAEEIGCRRKVFNQVKSILLQIWPEAQIIMFGSVATNSFLPSSDIDVCVMTQKQLSFPDDLHKVADLIRLSQNFEVDAIMERTAIPIVKCAHNQTKLRMDINFNLNYVGQTVEWIQKMMFDFPLLEPMLLILKQFLIQRNLNDPYKGGLPSYALISMLVCFFEEIRRKNKDMRHLDFLQMRTARGRRPLGFLFIYFLEMYGNFDFINNGIDFYKKISRNENERGRNKIVSSITSKHRLAEYYGNDVYSDGFWVTDPVQKGNNLGKGAYNLLAIKAAFIHAYVTLHNALVQLNDRRRFSDELIEHCYCGPLISLVVNTECMHNRSSNVENLRHFLFGNSMETIEEEMKLKEIEETTLIKQEDIEDQSIINDENGIINSGNNIKNKQSSE